MGQSVIKLAFSCLCMGLAAFAYAGKNVLPVVSLGAPANGAVFSHPATIVLTATASDADGTIRQVDFYNGATKLGTALAAPYSFTWQPAATGSYSLSAKAIDNAGGVGSSQTANVTVSTPQIAITSPASGAAVYGGTVNVAGSFVGGSDTVVLVDNGQSTRQATLSGNTFQATLPVFIGPNTVNIAVARRDRTFDKASVSFVGAQVPTLAWTSPAATQFDAPATLKLGVSAISPSGSISSVQFRRNGSVVGTVNAAPYEVTLSNLGAGNYQMSAIATDNNGQTATVWRSIDVIGPNALPTVSMTAPAPGTTLTAPASLTLRASASDPDGSITMVDFLKDGVSVGATNIAPYAATISNLAAGDYAFAARATDNRGGVSTSSAVTLRVVAPNAAPVVAMTSPASGATFIAPATIGLSAQASDSDGTVSKVEFLNGGVVVGAVAAPPFALAWTGVAPGSYQIAARATDNGGASTTSPPVQVTVNANSAPSVDLSSNTDLASLMAPAQVELSATAADADGGIAKVEFYNGQTLIGTASAAPYKLTWSGIGAGQHSVTAVAFDNLGASTVSAPLAVLVKAPSITIVAPLDGAQISGDSVLVSGSYSAPAGAGVQVNGIPAVLAGDGMFYAKVPLVDGPNTLEVALTTLAGQRSTQSRVVTGTGIASPLRVTASALEGRAPLVVTFALTNSGDSASTVSLNGGTPFTLEPGGEATIEYSLESAAASTLNFSETSEQGTTSQQFAVVAHAPETVDQRFGALWNGMHSAVAAGDKAGALNYLTPAARAKYGPVFDILGPDYAQFAASFSAPRAMAVSHGVAEYAVNRMVDGENRIYLIYFVRGIDGVWRLDAM